MKILSYVLVFVLSCMSCACTVALYYQNHTNSSKQEVTNPVELKSDSSHFNFEIVP